MMKQGAESSTRNRDIVPIEKRKYKQRYADDSYMSKKKCLKSGMEKPINEAAIRDIELMKMWIKKTVQKAILNYAEVTLAMSRRK